MNKVIYFFGILILLSGLIFSQSITVTNPHSGQTWYKGNTYTITWTKSGSMNANVKIRLYQGSTKILGIIDSTPNNGSYSWTIPASLASGTYYIRIKTIDNAVYDNSDAFTIKSKSGINFNTNNLGKNISYNNNFPKFKQKIKIFYPNKKSNWSEGKTYKIGWDGTYLKGKKVNIYLYDYYGKKNIKTIQTNWVLGNAYKWQVPKGIYTFPGNYRIKIIATDNSAEGLSDAFHIQKEKIIKKVILISPDDIKNKRKGFKQRNVLCETNRSDYVFWDENRKGIAIVGWGNSYREWGINCFFKEHKVARSYIHFNLSKLPKDAVIVSAVLKLKVTDHNYLAPGSVAKAPTETSLGKVLVLNSYWSDAFSVNGENIYSKSYDNLDTIKVSITKAVRSWIKGKNYGIMLISRDEAFHKTKELNVFYFKPSLEVVYLTDE